MDESILTNATMHSTGSTEIVVTLEPANRRIPAGWSLVFDHNYRVATITAMSDDPTPPDDGLPTVGSGLADAVASRDAAAIREQIVTMEFILISVQEEDDSEDDGMGALTADVDDQPALVVFTSERHAERFVSAMADIFEGSDEVQGFLVEGDALLDYLPEDYGLLFDPETDDAHLVDALLARALLDGHGTAEE